MLMLVLWVTSWSGGKALQVFWSYLVSLLVWLPTIPLELFYILSYFFLFFLREHCCCPEGSGGWCKIEKCAWKNSKNSFRTRSPLLLDHRYPVYSLLCCSLHIRSQTKSSCSVEGHEKKSKLKQHWGYQECDQIHFPQNWHCTSKDLMLKDRMALMCMHAYMHSYIHSYIHT